MRSPFKFLDAYTVQDKNVFFGRDSEIESLYTLVFKTNLLIVYGLSGTGKTSLIQCGLASRFDGPDWYPLFIRRTENLNDAIRLTMETALRGEAKGDLLQDVSYLIRKTLRPVYLIFDQFEELFVLGTHDEQVMFMRSLRKLLDSGINAKVILVMREEYIGQLYPFETDIPNLFDFRFRVEPMGIAKVKSVIQDSFDKFNIHLEAPVDESLQFMVDQITDPKSGIALPYLQVYLDMLYRDTWRRKFGKEGTTETLPNLDITRENISSLGRIGNVLEKFLGQQIRELNAVMRNEFTDFPENGIQLILDPFASDEGTKRPLNYTRSGETVGLDSAVQKVLPKLPDGSLTRAIELLDQARILRVREDTIELAHDSLAAVVERKRTDEQRQLQELRRRLTYAYEEFEETGVYLNEKQLAAFDVLKSELSLSEELLKFIQDSSVEVQRKAEEERTREKQELEAKQQRRIARIRTNLLSIVALFAIGGGISGFYWSVFYKNANENKEKLGLQSQNLVSRDSSLQATRDSIQNILTQVGQQVILIDSLVVNSRSEYIPKREVEKALITLKSLLTNDTINVEDLEQNYASVMDSVIMTTEVQNDSLPVQTHQLLTEQDVIAFARIRTRKPDETLQVKWLDHKKEIIGNPIYIKVSGSKPVQLIKPSTKFKESGSYSVRIDNSLGIQIGSADFIVKNSTVDIDKLSIKPGNFKIVASVVNNIAGEEVRKFKSGSTVYYWGRINCPKERAIAIVTVERADDHRIIWEQRHDIAMNDHEGYLIWSAKGFSGRGTYIVRVRDGSGEEITPAKSFVID